MDIGDLSLQDPLSSPMMNGRSVRSKKPIEDNKSISGFSAIGFGAPVFGGEKDRLTEM